MQGNWSAIDLSENLSGHSDNATSFHYDCVTSFFPYNANRAATNTAFNWLLQLVSIRGADEHYIALLHEDGNQGSKERDYGLIAGQSVQVLELTQGTLFVQPFIKHLKFGDLLIPGEGGMEQVDEAFNELLNFVRLEQFYDEGDVEGIKLHLMRFLSVYCMTFQKR